MVEGVGVSDEQLDEWERAVELLDRIGSNATRDLIGEVRASHTREAALRRERDEWESEAERAEARFDEFRRVAVDIRKKLMAERDELRERIAGQLTQAEVLANLPPHVRAALTGTGNQSTEETP